MKDIHGRRELDERRRVVASFCVLARRQGRAVPPVVPTAAQRAQGQASRRIRRKDDDHATGLL